VLGSPNWHNGFQPMDYNDVLPEEAKRVSDVLLAFMRQLTAGLDDPAVNLPLAQLRVCGVLRAGPLPMSAIGRELGASLSAMTQIADRLERARLVKRVPRGDDRRVRCLQLTDRGERMMQLHEDARLVRMSRVLENLTPDERREVTVALQTLVRAAAVSKGQDGNPTEPGPYLATSKVFL
jgi:DNA-binding MarR family transcriptional regulator